MLITLTRTKTAYGPVKLIRDTRTPHPLRLFSFWSPTPSLAGTVAHHDAYVLLHAHSPPSDYPARSKSPLWRDLTLKARVWGGLVNFAWSPEQAVHGRYTGLGELRGDEEEEEEAYVASVFSTSRRSRLHIPEVTLANVDVIDAEIRAHCCPRLAQPDAAQSQKTAAERVEAAQPEEKLVLYVCTHGSRDCRCGDTGGEVARALRAQVAQRGIQDEVFVGQVAHVGGHKYAANILVYPYGEWLGTVQETDVPRILDELLAWHALHRTTNSAAKLPPLCPPFWRGRMGLSKDEQLALVSKNA